MALLDKINTPQGLQTLNMKDLSLLAEEIRQYILHSVSQTGGHLASNLGIVELITALHYTFDFKRDHLLWDVGHQCYAHKILTGRKDRFHELRKPDGLSGFPNPAESEYDRFAVGHAGTAIATAIGMALAAQKKQTDEKVVAIVGDASIVNGASFEALNNLHLVKRQMLIVLNDNSMAIDATQGAIARFLSKVRLNHTYEDLRESTSRLLKHLPVIGEKVDHALEDFKKALRMAFKGSRLFESLNIPYFGPVDGHDVSALVQLFQAISHLNTPAILHVYTKKGKGFTPADSDPSRFHSTGPFKINGDDAEIKKGQRTFTHAFADAVVDVAREDDRVVAITAAMTDGTGLRKFHKQFPDRYYDVGIAESAAVDMAAGMAKQSLRPLVCIYSTFLQRSYDQIFQEVALANLPVIFCIDRSGPVGSDGPTHHGMMDIGYMRCMPNMSVVSPATASELRLALQWALRQSGPVAVRYPKDVVPNGKIPSPNLNMAFEEGRSVEVISGDGTLYLIAFGPVLKEACDAAQLLAEKGVSATVINARFVKPIDEKIISLACSGKCIITLEDHSRACGFGSAVLESAALFSAQSETMQPPKPLRVVNLAGPDEFIAADSRHSQLSRMGISPKNIAAVAEHLLYRDQMSHVKNVR